MSNASNRAVAVLEGHGFIDRSEVGPVKAVLSAGSYLCCCYSDGSYAAFTPTAIAGIGRDRR